MKINYLNDNIVKYIKSWPIDAQRKYIKMGDKLEEYGLEILIKSRDVVPFRKCEVTMYEFRPKIFRLFFTIIKDTIWVVSGYQKDDNETPKREKERAINLIKSLRKQ